MISNKISNETKFFKEILKDLHTEKVNDCFTNKVMSKLDLIEQEKFSNYRYKSMKPVLFFVLSICLLIFVVLFFCGKSYSFFGVDLTLFKPSSIFVNSVFCLMSCFIIQAYIILRVQKL